MIYSPSNPARIGFEIDHEKEDDMVIADNEGKKLLLLGPDMVEILGTFVLDYKEEPDDSKFTIKNSLKPGLL